MSGVMKKNYKIGCEVRKMNSSEVTYYDAGDMGIVLELQEQAAALCNATKEKAAKEKVIGGNQTRESSTGEAYKQVYKVTLTNKSGEDFRGVIHMKLVRQCEEPKFFMPGYMYNRNTAHMPSSGRKAFPRIREDAGNMPESTFFMTRSDRLAEPISLLYDKGSVLGVSAAPYLKDEATGAFAGFCGFSCNIADKDGAGIGYTLGYENAPWLFIQTATVKEREPLSEKNAFYIAKDATFSFEMTVYDYQGEDERAIYTAIEDCYWQFHEKPRSIPGMDARKAMTMLSSSVRDYAWLEEEKMYSGFVYDRADGLQYNRIPSVSWTNGLAVAVPMLLVANELQDQEARRQSVIFVDHLIKTAYNPQSGFLYESEKNGKPSVRGWWYDGMHSGGHSSYLNGQAVYYLLKAYRNEKEKRNVLHDGWLEMAGSIVEKMNTVLNTDYEYPFAMSEKTGAGLEYDSMSGAWFLAASAMYELVSGDRTLLTTLLKSEEHYYRAFVKKAECYGTPLDTDKAVDSEGILAYIRAVRLLHEITGSEELLLHMRDALAYEFSFKLGYNTPVMVSPLKEIGWSSCGGSITSTANPHIHPMSSTIINEMKYFLQHCADAYVQSRMEDTLLWSLQTFNTRDGEYGYGKVGWMSERFCFCEGLVTEKYPDGRPASTWFTLMPWAVASLLEGLVSE